MPWPDIALDTGLVCTKDFAKALAALILAIDERRELLGYDAILWPYNEAGDTKAGPVSTDFVGLRINGMAITNVLAEIRVQIQDLYDGNPDVEWYTDDTFATLIDGIITPPDDAVKTASTWKADHDSLNLLVYTKVPGIVEGTCPPKYQHTSVEFDSKIWMLQGLPTPQANLHYSSDGITWTSLTYQLDYTSAGSSVTQRVKQHTSVVFDSKMWIIGGLDFLDSDSYHGCVYSSTGTTWTKTIQDTSKITYGHASVVFLGSIWNFGGANSNSIFSSSNGSTWTQQFPSGGGVAFTARQNHTAFVLGSKVFIAGGEYAGVYKNDVWSSTDGKNWVQETSSAEWGARSFITSAVVGGTVYLIGGSNDDNIWKSTDGVTWTLNEYQIPVGIIQHATTLFGGKAWNTGGLPTGKTYTFDSVGFDLTPYLTDQQP